MSELPYRRFILGAGLFVFTVGLVVLVGGWALDVRALRSVIPGTVSMKPATALSLACFGVALALLRSPALSRGRRAGVGALCAVPALFGVLTLAEYVFGVDLGIDEMLFADVDGRAAGLTHPGRLAPTTAVNFLLVAAALTTLERQTRSGWRVGELLAVPVALIDWMSLIGYAYGIPAFYGPAGAAKMAVPTALCFELLALGILLARPRGRLLALARTDDPGGVMVRRLVPIAVLVPLGLGWLRLRTIQWGLFEDNVGTWWLSTATIAAEVAMIMLCANSLSRVERGRRESDLRLQESHRELARSNHELERFAAVVSHDVRAPLRTIRGFLELLERRPDDPGAPVWRAHVRKAAGQMDELIGGLHALAQVQHAPQTLERVALDTVLDDVELALSANLSECGAQVKREPLPVVEGDAAQLRALLQNLVANACKFSQREQPSIAVYSEPEGLGWQLVVADDGIGIDPRYAEDVFDMGRRLHAGEEYEGTGTGLAICRAIATRHGGSIAARPRDGGGTEMRVHLPG